MNRPPQHDAHVPRGDNKISQALADRYFSKRPKKQRPRSDGDKLRSSARWQEVRRLVMNRYNWICVDPFDFHKYSNVTVHAQELHHIVPINVDSDQAFDDKNLAPLCEWCHDGISSMERRGRGKEAQAMFAGRLKD